MRIELSILSFSLGGFGGLALLALSSAAALTVVALGSFVALALVQSAPSAKRGFPRREA